MVEGHRRARWDYWSVHLSLTRNLNRGEKDPPTDPEDFHPYREKVRSQGASPAVVAAIAAARQDRFKDL